MASALSLLPLNQAPKFGSSPDPYATRVKAPIKRSSGLAAPSKVGPCYGRLRRLNAAGLTEIEPDLNEDPKDRWATNGVSQDDFVYGEYDDHHTYHETHDKASFWESLAEEYAVMEPVTGFQGLISWLFLPAVAAGMYFNAPGEYLYIGAALFTVVFCIIEMDKPSEAHNFEPQIYNMDRGLRDKLISDYNTMDIWDFNEKYGELWDFTVKNDDIVKT